MEKYHERIVSLHLKDRTKAGGNLPWGQGETPIKEILLPSGIRTDFNGIETAFN